MGKNKEMLKVFFKVLTNDKDAIKLVTPKSYVKTIYDIDYKKLLANGYKNIIFDIDNTLLPVNDINVDDKLIEFIKELKKEFNICILSNNGNWRVDPVKKALNVSGFANANKPKKDALDKSLEILKSKALDTVMVGDQMLTDTVFANKYNLYSILVEPVKNKYDIKTGTSRLLQNIMMKKLKTIKRYKYYM